MGYWLAVLGQWSEGVCEQMGMKLVKKKIVVLVTLPLNPGLSVLGAASLIVPEACFGAEPRFQ